MVNSDNNKNFLILIGGAEDKTDKKVILQKTIETAEAKSVAVITTASSYPAEVFRNYESAFRQLGITDIYNFDIRSRQEADRQEYLEKIEKTNLVFFGGGDQVKLVEELDGTNLLEIILNRFHFGTLTIAGTSAGAAAASNPMLYDGDYRGFLKGSVNSGKGFGLIKEITIDTHFLNRERMPRLTQYLSAGYSTKGIGLDEDTAIFISPDLTFEVVGSGMITIVSNDKVSYSNFNDIEENQKFSINDLRFGFLSEGSRFDLKHWTVLKNTEVKKGLNPDDIFSKSYLLNS